MSNLTYMNLFMEYSFFFYNFFTHVAMDMVGVCYKNGEGVIKNLIKAKEWYMKAAAQGDMEAQEALDKLNQ